MSAESLDQAICALILHTFPFGERPPLPTIETSEWQPLVDRARYQGLVPLLSAALQGREMADVPPETARRLQDQYRSTALASAAALGELDALVCELDAAALPHIILKGAALARWLYPQPALRPFGDLDLLSRQQNAAQIDEILAARGYSKGGELAAGFAEAYYSEMAYTRQTPPRIHLDLHWELFVPLYYRRRLDPEWFWQHTMRVGAGAAPMRILDPTAQLVHLSVHATLNHQHDPRLIWLYDLALLLAHADKIDWQAVLVFVNAAGLGQSVADILEQTARAWGVAAPAEPLAALEHAPSSAGDRTALALTVAPQNQARVLADALSSPGVGNKARYALRHLFPAPAYMRERYHIRRNVLLPAYYVVRFAESSVKLVRSLWSAFVR